MFIPTLASPTALALVTFSLADGRLAFRCGFPHQTGPVDSFLNDLAVDDERGFLFVASCASSPAPMASSGDDGAPRGR